MNWFMDKSKRNFLSLFWLLNLVLCTPFAFADIYQWVDEHGKVHFTDRKPDSSAKTEKLKTIEYEPQKVNYLPPSDSEVRARQERTLHMLSEDRKVREDAREKRKQGKAERMAKCNKLRNQIERRKSVNVFYREKEDGSVEWIPDAERDQWDKKLKARYEKHCS